MSVSAKPMTLRAFVKLFGDSKTRAGWTLPVLREVERSGCHWACSYPEEKRPRSVQTGDIIFMGRLVDDPHDILVFGRAIAIEHVPGRDDATSADIELRPWKARWPRYVRVKNPEFIDGTLGEGVKLFTMMDALGADAFVSTKRNATEGSGNSDPKKAYRQQAAVELTPEAAAWLTERLDRAFAENGKISEESLARLDWPEGWGPTRKGAGG